MAAIWDSSGALVPQSGVCTLVSPAALFTAAEAGKPPQWSMGEWINET